MSSKAFQELLPIILDGALNFVAAVIILVVGWTAAGWAAQWTRSALDRLHHIDITLKPIIASLARYLIIVVTVMAVLERFGVQTTSIIAMLGAAGLAVGLAIQGTLSNVASGVMLLLLRSMRAGEDVSTAGYSGTVREVGLFRTVLISGDGLYVSIPNSTVFGAPIVNNSREPFRQVNFRIAIDLAADVGAAQELGLEVLRQDTRVLKQPAPAVLVAQLGDWDIALAVQAWVLTGQYGAALSDLQKNIRQAFRQAGIQAPQRILGLAGARATLEEAARRRSA